MSTTPTQLLDPDLHGLVDGLIAPERRPEALRRLAGTPADRLRVESWQSQNDFLRSAFGAIAREALPPMLDLKVRPKLHCIPAIEAAPPVVESAVDDRLAGAHRWLAGLMIAVALIGAGIGGWRYLAGVGEAPPVLRETGVEATVAHRAEEALDRLGPVPTANPLLLKALPVLRIPDLGASGFSFVGAEVEGRAPATIAFRYQNESGERLVVAVAAGPDLSAGGAGERTGPMATGASYAWRGEGRVYAIAGNLRPARLRILALSLIGGAD